METPEDRDSWLEGVRRWYFGGTPGPDDDVDKAPADSAVDREASLAVTPSDH